jgi:hypothetical protein
MTREIYNTRAAQVQFLSPYLSGSEKGDQCQYFISGLLVVNDKGGS